jgi:hypothetical protein
MWCLINHTKRHIIHFDLFDIGRQIQGLLTYSSWKLNDHIDIEEVSKKSGKYPDYIWDV